MGKHPGIVLNSRLLDWSVVASHFGYRHTHPTSATGMTADTSTDSGLVSSFPASKGFPARHRSLTIFGAEHMAGGLGMTAAGSNISSLYLSTPRRQDRQTTYLAKSFGTNRKMENIYLVRNPVHSLDPSCPSCSLNQYSITGIAAASSPAPTVSPSLFPSFFLLLPLLPVILPFCLSGVCTQRFGSC